MIIKLILLFLTLLNFNSSFSQDSTIIYYDKDWDEQDWKIDAVYYRVLTEDLETKLISVKDYWITGEIQMSGTFISNTKKESRNGEFIWYEKRGTIDWQVNYLKGEKNGIQKEWYGKDSLMSSSTFLNDKFQGKYVSYYENGQIEETGAYVNDKEVGTWDLWFEDGIKEGLIKYNVNNSGVDSVYRWHSNGIKELEGVLFETDLSYYKYGNFWDDSGKQTVKGGNGTAILDVDDNEYWKGKVSNGQFTGTWLKYQKQKGRHIDTSILGEIKLKKGNIKSGFLYFQNKKIKLSDGWTKSPKFPNGQKGLNKYVSEFLGGCRKDIIENTVYVEFVVLSDGNISDVQIISGKTTLCQKENIMEMFLNMPTWTPGIQMGDFVKVRYAIPIKYSL